MIKKILFVLLLVSTVLNADSFKSSYKIDVLYNNAQKLSQIRNFKKSNQLLLKALDINKNSNKVIQLYISNLVSQQKFEKAQKQLQIYSSYLDDYKKTELEIIILISLGKVNNAQNLAFNYLNKNKGKVNIYKQLAFLFSRYNQSKQAINIYTLGQKNTNNPKLFTWDLALAYQKNNNNVKALNTMLMYLNKVNQNAIFMVFYRVKNILDKDKNNIVVIEKYVNNNKGKQLKELLAKSYYHLKNYNKAINIYSKLDERKFFSFINEIFAQGKYNNSIIALNKYLNLNIDKIKKTNANLMLAKCYYNLQNYKSSKLIFENIYNNEAFFKKNRYRTKARFYAGEYLYNIALINKNFVLAEKYIKNQSRYCYNNLEKKISQLKYIRFLQLTSKSFKPALKSILKTEDKYSKVSKQANFILFEDALKNKQAIADTILVDIIVNSPNDEKTINALELSYYVKQIPDSLKTKFWQAYNLINLKQKQKSLQILTNLYKKSNKDVFIIYALKVSIKQALQNKTFMPKQKYNEFAIKLHKIQNNLSNTQTACANFLKVYSKDAFAPLFRYYLNNKDKKHE